MPAGKEGRTMDKPLVSVCIPTYNNEDTIEETVSSVLRQTWKNLELVIVDDGSSDRTYELVTELAAEDKRIRLYRNGKNLGIGHTGQTCDQ